MESVEEYIERLRRLEEENARLRAENLEMGKMIDRMREERKRDMEELQKNMEERFGKQLDGIYSMLGMGIGEEITKKEQTVKPKTSTPNVKMCSDSEKEIESNIKGKQKVRRRKSGGKGNSCKQDIKHVKSKSMDSLYSTENEKSSNEIDDETSDSDDPVEVRKSVLIREIPKVSKFNVYGSKDVNDFFKEYENYCKVKFPENQNYWVKELEECLDGRMLEFYRMITSVGEPKYEVVKARMIDHVKRVKAGVRYRKTNDFEKAKMGKTEQVDMYAYRLETLARKKFGDEGINESKPLLRKFLETVPRYVAEQVNMKRKEKYKWTKERLLWEDVLEMIEDRAFEDNGRIGETDHVDVNVGRGENFQYKTYKDALHANPMEVMGEFLKDFYGKNPRNNVDNRMTGINGNAPRNKVGQSLDRYQENQWQTVQNGRNRKIYNNHGGRDVRSKCLRCGKFGHRLSECRWKNGACFGCGSTDHMISQCQSSGAACFGCGQQGHLIRNCQTNRANGNIQICGNCGQNGHFLRMCTKELSQCERCGKNGHLTRLCRRQNVVANNRNVERENVNVNVGTNTSNNQTEN